MIKCNALCLDNIKKKSICKADKGNKLGAWVQYYDITIKWARTKKCLIDKKQQKMYLFFFIRKFLSIYR